MSTNRPVKLLIQIQKYKSTNTNEHKSPGEVINSDRVFIDAALAVNRGREYINTNENEASNARSRFQIQ